MMRLVAAMSGFGAAVWWLTQGPWKPQARRELDAVGFRPAAVQMTAWFMAAAMSLAVAMVVDQRVGRDAAVLAAATMLPWAGVWLPRAVELSAVSAYRVRRDRAALAALRRMRLLVAGGVPLEAAAQQAAQDEPDPAFGPIAADVHDAVDSMASPLTAIGKHLSSGPASTLLAAAESAEEGGSESGANLDALLGRAVGALEGERRIVIETLGGWAMTAATMTTVLATGLLMAALMTSLGG